MVRPCYLVIDPEHSGSLSTRKLVLESAKLNVITAYSGEEAVQTIARFPSVDGVVCNAELRDMGVPALIAIIKQQHPRLPVIVVGPHHAPDAADFLVPSFDPAQLLETIQRLNSQKVSAIIEHEDHLRAKE